MPGGRGYIRPAPGVRRAAAGTRRCWSCAGLQDPLRPAWLVRACIVVSLVAGVRPEEGPGDLAGRKAGSVLDEGRLPELVKAAACTHADDRIFNGVRKFHPKAQLSSVGLPGWPRAS